jgi:hypothetical protein
MSKFSPGPWVAVEPNWDHRPEMHIKQVDDTQVVAIVAPWGGQDMHADARLIAAAPEMYDLLERLLAESSMSDGDKAETAILLARIDGDGK